jgi:hypothetical protein
LLSAPSDIDAIWTLSEGTGDLTKTGGNSKDFIPGDHQRGSFVITGEPTWLVNFTVAVSTPFSDPGLNLAITPSAGTLLLGLGGDVQVDVGGVLTIHTTVVSGPHSGAVITIIVNYE